MNEWEYEEAVGQWRVSEVPTATTYAAIQKPRPEFRSLRAISGACLVSGLFGGSLLLFSRATAEPVSLNRVVAKSQSIKNWTLRFSQFSARDGKKQFDWIMRHSPGGYFTEMISGDERLAWSNYFSFNSTRVFPSQKHAIVVSRVPKASEFLSPLNAAQQKWLYESKELRTEAHVIFARRDCTRYSARNGSLESEVYVDSISELPVAWITTDRRTKYREEKLFSYELVKVEPEKKVIPRGFFVYDWNVIKSQVRTIWKSKNRSFMLFSQKGELAFVTQSGELRQFGRSKSSKTSFPQLNRSHPLEISGEKGYVYRSPLWFKSDLLVQKLPLIKPGSRQAFTGNLDILDGFKTYHIHVSELPIVYVDQVSTVVDSLFSSK